MATRLQSSAHKPRSPRAGRRVGVALPSSDVGDVYRELRDAIVSGRFLPNQRLVEADLGGMFKVGRTSIRSALTRLHQEGLVSRERNRGARVRRISDREAVEIEQVRIALEKLLARLAGERATQPDLVELNAMVEAMRERVAADDSIGYSELNARFHQRIWRIADHQVASDLLVTLKSQSIRFQYRTMLRPGRAADSLREHEAIVVALGGGDADACEAAMGEHLRHVVETLQWAIATQHVQSPWSPS
ncbi:MAG: GntR family transcriptional regulator [Candidatus Dormibacteraeota bacterium]|uniref:GntR family transcriptional regulator n=1 Tax=Candidatus Aeolococcus gillhamiae TaxID=3127015 RepID=A0A934JXJ2_9BACT|nr:GntR family transcriptional regulator [Candidatus Dormibacteraeota bacterium]